MLIYPQRLPTSSLFEAGYAFALRKPSVYFGSRHDIPYLLRDLPNLSTEDQAALGAHVLIHDELEWKTCEDIARMIRHYHARMFAASAPAT